MSFESRIEMIETIAAEQRERQRARADLERHQIELAAAHNQERAPERSEIEFANSAGFGEDLAREQEVNEQRVDDYSVQEAQQIEYEDSVGFGM